MQKPEVNTVVKLYSHISSKLDNWIIVEWINNVCWCRLLGSNTLEIKKISPKKVVVDLTANGTLYPKISIKRETMEYIIKKELLEGEV